MRADEDNPGPTAEDLARRPPPPRSQASELEDLKAVERAVEAKIAKLDLEDGDMLVIQMPKDELIKLGPVAGQLQRLVPKGVRVLLMPASWDLTMVTKAQIDEALERE